jgi:hypothetical protein
MNKSRAFELLDKVRWASGEMRWAAVAELFRMIIDAIPGEA